MIKVLDKNTINQIAAGEVIERPASVVKELIENSIDAGATAVSCEIKNGGIDLIRITDNGSGIPSAEIRTAFLRHATSKINDASDLSEVTSLGFRGEALASIAAVAEVEVLTRCKGETSGVRYRISGGEELGLEMVGCPEGTTFIIRNLFANVPVRRKFLKTPTTEGAYISDLVEKIALSHPEVSIKFISNSRTAIYTNGSRSIKDIIYGIYGREITSALAEIDYNDEDSSIRVSGFVAKPIVARANRNLEHYYVNGRYIRSNVVSKAIEDAFAPYLMMHKYPFTALHIEIPMSVMDVNVHPTKQEVRFAEPDTVYKVVFEAVSSSLKTALLIPKVITPSTNSIKDAREAIIADTKKQLAPEPFENKRRETEQILTAENKENPEKENPVKESSVKDNSVKESSVKENQVKENEDETVLEDKPKDIKYKNTEDSRPVYAQLVMETDESNTYVSSVREETKENLKKSFKEGYNIVGQVFDTYWIVERDGEMFIIDQHAAHEKVIYERLVAENHDLKADSQMISPPMILSFTGVECEVIENHLNDLKELGYEMESFGGREYSISSIPLQLYSLDPESLLLEIISSFEESDKRAIKTNTITLKERLATCSCKAAVKGNTRMSTEEARSLIEQLLKLDNPFNCPHGRPVIVSMTKQELEKKFKRII